MMLLRLYVFGMAFTIFFSLANLFLCYKMENSHDKCIQMCLFHLKDACSTIWTFIWICFEFSVVFPPHFCSF